MSMAESFLYQTTESDTGTRADAVLAYAFPDVSRTRLARALRAGEILLDSKPCAPQTKVTEGSVFSGMLPQLSPTSLLPQPELPIQVIFEDSHLLVIDKPAGMATHPAPGQSLGTVANWVLAHAPETASVGEDSLRPGIVHRLDQDTSGILLLAKTPTMFTHLKAQFQSHTIQKIYTTFVFSHLGPLPCDISSRIVRSKHDPTKMTTTTDPQSGRSAHTTLQRVLQQFEVPFLATLLEVLPHTGRMHQIRVHLNSLGHPVIGDHKYSRRDFLRSVPPHYLPPRQLLHASQVSFLDLLGVRQTYTSRLPKDFMSYLQQFS